MEGQGLHAMPGHMAQDRRRQSWDQLPPMRDPRRMPPPSVPSPRASVESIRPAGTPAPNHRAWQVSVGFA